MPFPILDSLHRRLKTPAADFRISLARSLEIQADAANSSAIHFVERGIGSLLVNYCDAAGARTELLPGVQRAAVVRAIDGRLHDDHAAHVQRLVQGAQFLDGNRLRRVRARGRKRKMLRIESMDVAVAGALGHGEIHGSRWLRSAAISRVWPPGQGSRPRCNRTKHNLAPREHGQSSG